MEFIFSAGVRLGIREGMVGLPDEESILMYDEDVNTGISQSAPFEDCCPLRGLHLRPGEHANVAIRYGQCRPLQDVVWVTQIVYGARSWAVAIKVANVSDRDCWIEPRTPVARIAEYGNIPIVGQFVYGMATDYSGKYLVREGEGASGARVRHEAYEQIPRDAAPPAVMVPKYKWPTKLLVRPREPERAQVTKIVEELQPQRDADGVESVEDATSGAYSPSVIGSLMAVEAPPELVTLDVDTQDGGEVVNPESCGEVPDETPRRSECDGDPSTEDEDFELSSPAAPGTPLARLDAAYARCMRVSAEELDLEPAVYIREGSELMSQLKDLLVMLPDLDDLSPECDIKAADVGESGE
ncbi:hypothetical protein PHMEG_00040288, partial [Phytophthora megakarya]